MANAESGACKKKRKRTMIPPSHLDKLESLFKKEQWPSRAKKEDLAAELGQTEHFVSIWFQNRRARMKREEAWSLEVLKSDDNETKSQDFTGQPAEESVKFPKNSQGRIGKEGNKLPLVITNGSNLHKNIKIVKAPMKLFIKPKDGFGGKRIVYPVAADDRQHEGGIQSEANCAQDAPLEYKCVKVIPKSQNNTASCTSTSTQSTGATASIEQIKTPRNENSKSVTLFQAIVNMMAVVEGGIMSPQDPDFPAAANDALYGININNDTRLIYDKETGLEFVAMSK